MSVEVIKSALDSIHGFEEVENGVRLNTQCLYPSNALVRVCVMGAGETYFVTDEGRAFREASLAGATLDYKDKAFARMLSAQGLQMKGGVIRSPQVGIDAMASAVLAVANASKDVAEWIFEHWKLERPRKFKDLLHALLVAEFQQIQKQEIVGESNKPHTFENVVQFMNGSRLLVDAVVPDTNSINARVVANLDVKSAKHLRLIQRIVYDDEDEWKPDDLTLLQFSGVPVIPFSKSQGVIKRLAAEHGA